MGSEKWETLIPMSNLGPGYPESARSFFAVKCSSSKRFTHLRLNMFPDGGIARIRTYGISIPDPKRISRMKMGFFNKIPSVDLGDEESQADLTEDLVDLAAMENGGICVGYSDAHYGHPR